MVATATMIKITAAVIIMITMARAKRRQDKTMR